MSPVSVGIDLGASTIHVVVLDAATGARPTVAATGARPTVAAARAFDAANLGEVAELVAGTQAVAIDAPMQLSTAPHRDDESISTKFRVARCGEIALGQQARIWVPWVTPADASKVPPWMQVGFDLWTVLRAAGHEPIEVYPAGVFRVLAGVVPPRKTTRAGLRARVELLARRVELPAAIETWSHDGIDALGSALTAHQKAAGVAREVGHSDAGCDGSAIWLPATSDTD